MGGYRGWGDIVGTKKKSPMLGRIDNDRRGVCVSMDE